MIRKCPFDGAKLGVLGGRDASSCFTVDFVLEFICPTCRRRWYFSRDDFGEKLVYLGKVEEEEK